MKKSLLLLLLLVGLSAYALNNKSCRATTASPKLVEKKMNTHTLSPLADLFSFTI